jgi:tripartite-type tricarboxylate transporter receptor subunit TctC
MQSVRKIVVVAMCAALALVAGYAIAEEYPTRPITVMVSYTPGGATDFQARIATMTAQDHLGQPIVIMNRPGAGGQVGWNWFAEQARTDGYDLAAYNFPHLIAQSIVFDTRYNTDNIEPIANWGADPAVLIVGRNSQFETAEDLIEYARENPGRVTVSGAGMYVGHHIATLQLERAAGIQLRYIPTPGGVDAMRHVMGGQVMAGFNNLADAYRAQDRLRILAVADLERNERFLPDVPTLKELGYDVDDSSVNFRGIMAPQGTPQEVIDLLAEKVPAMFQDDTVLAKMEEGGAPVRVLTREEVQQMAREKHETLRELLAELREEEAEKADQ